MIYRLIQYVTDRPERLERTLRRSLVGRMSFPNGVQITATILDDVTVEQELAIRRAARQPGVWLSNATAMEREPPPYSTGDGLPGYEQGDPAVYRPHPGGLYAPDRDSKAPERWLKEQEMITPNTGPAYSTDAGMQARHIAETFGLKFAHTLALALSSIVEELAANAEPEKFLTREECLQLAQALMDQVPAEWQGDQAEDGGSPAAPTGEQDGDAH